MKRYAIFLAATLILAGGTAFAAEKHSHDSHDSHSTHKAAPAKKSKAGKEKNPVQDEMNALNEAFKKLLDAIVLNEPEKIELPFHHVHHAREKTVEALKKGEVKLPRNPDKLDEFMKLDDRFHHEVEEIIEAANKKDMKAVTAKTHKLFDSCIECHEKFRNK